MGRARKGERISTATWADVYDTLYTSFDKHGVNIDVTITHDLTARRLYVEALAMYVDEGKEKREVRVGRYCNATSFNLSTTVYQVSTLCFHKLDYLLVGHEEEK